MHTIIQTSHNGPFDAFDEVLKEKAIHEYIRHRLPQRSECGSSQSAIEEASRASTSHCGLATQKL